jgi:hypothetical protein
MSLALKDELKTIISPNSPPTIDPYALAPSKVKLLAIGILPNVAAAVDALVEPL